MEDRFVRILRWRVSFHLILGATLLPLAIILSVIPIQLVVDPSARFDSQTILPICRVSCCS